MLLNINKIAYNNNKGRCRILLKTFMCGKHIYHDYIYRNVINAWRIETLIHMSFDLIRIKCQRLKIEFAA